MAENAGGMDQAAAPGARAPVIEAQGLVRHYGNVVALAGLDLLVRRGEVVGLLGHNGAGKTTLVRVLGCLLAAGAGTAALFGLPIADPRARVEIRRRIGVLPQDPGLYDRLTAEENLASHGRLYGLADAHLARRVGELLELVGLSGERRRRVGTFSGGMKKRLAIARALVNDPGLVFLDEPTTGLDPAATHAMHEHIAALAARGGCTIVLCTHNLAEAERLCSRVVILERGREVASGPPAELERRFGGARRAEIDARALDAPAVEAVRGAAGISAVRVVGPNQLELDLGGDGALPAAVAALVAAGAEVTRAVEVRPTLEDVYLRLAGGDAAGVGDAAGGPDTAGGGDAAGGPDTPGGGGGARK